MLEIVGLSKSFENTVALDDVSFKAAPGEIFALLGPNGAGKTTALRLIMRILKADQGEIIYNNQPVDKLKRNIFGYLPEERGLYQRVKVLDLLVYLGQMNRMSRHRAEVESIRYLDRMGMIDYTQRKVHELSKGMQQKIQFIIALLHNPDIIILDEPFTGLDPINQMVLREIIAQSREDEKTIILSTHQMAEVERLSDHICLINQGRIIYDGSVKEIQNRHKENAYYLEAADTIAPVKDMDNVKILEENNLSCKIVISAEGKEQKKLIQSFFDKMAVLKFEQVEPSLHDIFIKLVQADPRKKS